MKELVNKICLAILAVILCFGVNTISVQAATSAKVKSVSIKTDTGGDFVKGVSKAKISFKISGKQSNVTVKIINNSNKTVYKKTVKNCKANKTYTVTWSGRKTSGSYASAGNYRAKIEVGSSGRKSHSIKFITKTGFAGGDGSKSHPYKVSAAKQLKEVAKHNGRYFVQTKNINFSGSANYTGIFRAVGSEGVVKNIKAKNCNFSGNDYVGIIAGWNAGSITNCSAINCIVNGQNDCGAIAGHNEKGKLDKCKGTRNMVSTNRNNVGGIVGYSNGTVKNCSTKADALSSSSWRAGGIVGANNGTVLDCLVNESSIYGEMECGGIAGYSNSVVRDCTVYDEKGQIAVSYGKPGGIIGYMDGGIQTGNTYYGALNSIGN